MLGAVDVGTGSARAGIFTPDGQMLARAERRFARTGPGPEMAEASSAAIWQSVCEAVREACVSAGLDRLDAIGFDATCSLVLTGPDVTLSPPAQDVIMWYDHRANDQAARINATGDAQLQRVGGAISPEMELPKLLWLRENRPDLWARLGGAYDLADYLVSRAVGAPARSVCCLVTKWGWLAETRQWPQAYLERIGLPDLCERADLSGPVHGTGQPVGRLSVEAARDLGLNPDCVVAAGMVDAYAGALGVLDLQGETAALITGTSNCVMAVAPAPQPMPGIWGPYYDAIFPGLWVSEGGQSAAGAALDLILSRFGAHLPEALRNHGGMLDFVGECLADPGFGRDLHVLPDFNGNRSPHADPLARAVISGLTLDETPAGVAALYWRTAVGIALGVQEIIAHMKAHGLPVRQLAITGGHARHPLMRQLYADTTGLPVLHHHGDAVLRGTAIAARAALGGDLAAVARDMLRSPDLTQPDPARSAQYARDAAVFRLMQSQRREQASLSRGDDHVSGA